MISPVVFESRAFRTGGILVTAGTLLTVPIFGFAHAACFLAGGLLSAVNMLMLRRSINSTLSRGSNSRLRSVSSYILRLLLIPLCLYAIMRLFFFGIIAAIAGFVVFGCGIFLEGVLEAFKGSSR